MLKFKCGRCGSSHLIEIINDVMIESKITFGQGSNGPTVQRESENLGGYVLHYRCVTCDYILRDKDGLKVISEEELVECLSQ
mgnify:CR=1 FL=1